MKKRKPKVPKARNPFVLPARTRKGGTHKNKADKRAQEDKRDAKYLEDDY